MNEEEELARKEIKVIGVDIGGTKISAGLVGNGKIYKSVTIQTPTTEKQNDVIKVIIEAIRGVMTDEVVGIGVGIPGIVDTKSGTVYNVQNIPSFKAVHLKEILENKLERPVHVNNDANCFTLGTKNFGDGKQFHSLVGLTLGTGLGGGIIINDKLYEGMGNGAGEFGFFPYKDGILEHYCSGQFFLKQYNVTGEEAQNLALSGDKKALHMFEEFGYHLGEAIKMIVHTLSPEAVMLGGSISKNFDFFEQSMWANIRQFPYKNVINDLTVFPVLNPEIAIIGAAYLNERLF
ncbi:MAG: ROK family protein [Bacteroidales bacterium]|nr:ROK family protein [Bacteroidales bacterium]